MISERKFSSVFGCKKRKNWFMDLFKKKLSKAAIHELDSVQVLTNRIVNIAVCVDDFYDDSFCFYLIDTRPSGQQVLYSTNCPSLMGSYILNSLREDMLDD